LEHSAGLLAAVRKSRRAGSAWWQRAVIEQIAVPSFQDSNGDGYGGLPGLISRIDYLSWLGIAAIWLPDVLVFKHCAPEGELLIALNTAHQPRKFDLPCGGEVLLSTRLDQKRILVSDALLLRPDGGVIIKLGA